VARKLPQFFLADLVAIVTLCGLILGLFQSSGPPPQVIGLIFLIAAVVTYWLIFRALRNAPTCDECGRRFINPEKKKAPPPVCPHCGQLQVGYTRLRKALVISFWAVLALMLLSVVLAVSLFNASFVPTSPAIPNFGTFLIATMILYGLMIALLVARAMHGFARFKPVPCEKCGAIITRGGTTAPLICPQCRLGHLTGKQAKKEQGKGILVILVLLVMAALVPGFMLGSVVGSLLGLSDEIAILLTIVASVVVFVGLLFLVAILRARRLRTERFVLKLATKAAGEEGEVVRSGSTTVWYSGPTNPAPVLMEKLESTRLQLESLLGREVGSPPFLRILCFRKRRGFEAFFRPFTVPISHYMKTLSGLYFRQPNRILGICDEELPHLISDQDKTAVTLFCTYFLEALPGNPLASCVQRGISICLTAADDDLIRLNRKMLASLYRGTALGARLFEINDRELLEQLKGWADHRNFDKVDQFQAESWSVFEYLGGKQAPEERRERLRAFLADKQAKAHPAEAFERHFGFSLDRLVESWREWVQEQGIGAFTLPPPHVEEGLLNRLIPLIENRQGNREDRILAIRNMGSKGFVLGADALIGLLGREDAIPREELTWALEAISGMAYGDDPGRWIAWWNSLPAEVRERRHLSVASS
jgi:predicted RNA-binding Zn-ribbon protein involved in translation (DUF1610 family)